MPDTILSPDEPPAVATRNEGGSSPFLIVADHAGKRIPGRLAQLGLVNAECDRHIAWDIGAGAVADLIADGLDAVAIRQNYSRLVIDCNRTPGTATSIANSSELTPVPGNIGLSDEHRLARCQEIFQPYHACIASELDRRRDIGRQAILISVHSFTPTFKGVPRCWDVGILYNRDPRLGHSLLELLRREEGLIVGDNEPYSVSDASDYTIPVHGERRNLLHVAIEIRQDLITAEADQRSWAALLVRLIPQAAQRL